MNSLNNRRDNGKINSKKRTNVGNPVTINRQRNESNFDTMKYEKRSHKYESGPLGGIIIPTVKVDTKNICKESKTNIVTQNQITKNQDGFNE